MNFSKLFTKCYAKQEKDLWVACCLDFTLAAQGDSLDEVKRKLERQIIDYVNEALDDYDHGAQLLSRRAPLSFWLDDIFTPALLVILTILA